MRLLLVLFAFSSLTAYATTHTNSQAPQEESDVFHNSPFGPVEDAAQERQEEAPQWITPDSKQLREEVPTERVNEWQEQSSPNNKMGDE